MTEGRRIHRTRGVGGAIGLAWGLALLGASGAGCTQPAAEEAASARRVSAPGAAVRRIVSLAPSHTEVLFALGAGEQVVAVTEADDFPAAAAELPRVGGMTADTLDLERVLAARPDVVVALDFDQEQPVAALRRLGLRVEVIPASSLDDLFGAARRLGAISGREEAAERLAADLGERIERVRRAVAGLPLEVRPRVFYEVWDRPLMTAGPETFLGELIETAGGRNLFGEIASLYPRVSPEVVLRRDPEVILAPDYHGDPLSAEELAARAGWETMSAVRRGRVYTIDGDLVSRPGPRLVEALEIVARLLHPDRFPAAPERDEP